MRNVIDILNPRITSRYKASGGIRLTLAALEYETLDGQTRKEILAKTIASLMMNVANHEQHIFDLKKKVGRLRRVRR